MKSILKLRSYLPNNLKYKSFLTVIFMVMVSILETLSIALLIPIISNLINPDKNIQLYFIQYLGFLENLSKNEFIIVSFATVLIAYLIKNLFLFYFLLISDLILRQIVKNFLHQDCIQDI